MNPILSPARGAAGKEKAGQRTACLNSFDGLKRGIRPATVTAWPVRGFFSVRGLRRATENVPKPTSVTASPRFSEPRIPASAAPSARSEPDFGHPAAAAILTTRSALVIGGYIPHPP